MHLGFLTPAKGLRQVLGAVAAAHSMGVPVELVLVGEGAMASELTGAVQSLGLERAVRSTGWVDSESVRSLPAAADLGVVLRTPSAGETSAAAVRFLACGTPVAVAGLRQFLEWPEPAAPRVTPGPSAAAELTRVLGQATGPGWEQRRQAAREAYLSRHRPESAAAAMAAALEDL